jgi:prepilin-type processing-associated H-X9-DG protein
VASPARLIDYEGKAWLPDQAHGKSGGNIAFIDGRVELRPVFPAVSPPPATNEVLIPR